MTLTIENVSKTYPNGTRALDDVSLTIPPGMFGLLGPNGAGKSTLMRTVAALQEPDTGSVHLGDINALEEKQTLRRRLGYLPQEVGVYDNVSAETLLDHFATLKGITDRSERRRVVDALLNRVNLDGARDQNLGGYPGGMKRRFGIAVALIGDPDLIIVDEPTAGLDPAERVRFLNLLSEIGEDSVVLLSTHIVSDVEATASRLAIMHDGRLAATAAPEALIDRVRDRVWEWVVGHDELGRVRDAYQVTKATRGPGGIRVHAVAEQPPSAGATPAEPTLEDAYLSLLSGPTSPR